MQGDILVAKITPSFENGKIALVTCGMADGYSSTEFHVVRPKSSHVDPFYLLAYLRSSRVKTFCSQRMKGSAGQRRVPKEVLAGLMLNLPTVDVQRECAAKFKEIAKLIKLENEQLEKLDRLVKSRFVEMFGDPFTNPKKFPIKPGSKLFRIGNGKTKPAAERYESGIPAYGGNGISWYAKESLVDSPTIVIGRVGRHCGNTRLVNEPCWVTDNAMFIKEFLGDGLDLVYIDTLMQLVDFNRYADKGDLWKITQQPFMDFNFPLPPLALQQEFAAFVAQVDATRSIAQQQIAKLRMLYDSLAQEYFGD